MIHLWTFSCVGKIYFVSFCIPVSVSLSKCAYILISPHNHSLSFNRISRGESNNPDSDVHFFTSHFMTTLKDEGPEAVSSWTAKKNINIFKKKFVFIPVNADLHWSLCVVVNAGLIANSFDTENPVPNDEDHAW